MADMLLQSHLGKLELLPALPSVWTAGSIRGLRAVGNFGIDIEWQGGKATSVVIISGSGQPAHVKYPSISTLYTVLDSQGTIVVPTIINDDEISFPTEVGGVYTILPSTVQTGIHAIQANSTHPTAYYDLSGRPVATPRHGLYIMHTDDTAAYTHKVFVK